MEYDKGENVQLLFSHGNKDRNGNKSLGFCMVCSDDSFVWGVVEIVVYV